MQRFREPAHANRGAENGAAATRISASSRLPQKWTLTQPRKLRRCSDFGGF